ncbi:MAG: AAA family ATPase, partial [Desulfobulbaceae bacterium]|nr:AAA family ATPase [Desulfobulbaceae bacterium]
MSRIFISYRRHDSADITGRIYDHLVRKFGRESVFKDVDAIPPGADFRDAIRSAVSTAVVFLAVIGDRWLTVADEERRRRIDDPNDFVRIEVETALKRDFQLIPLLVRGAHMPTEAELPEALRALSYRNALPVRNDPDFSRDIERLIQSITGVVSVSQGHNAEERTGAEQSCAASPSRFLSTPVEEIKQQIKGRLCGQEVAVNQVMPWIKRLRFGLLRDDKPAATFLFVGQSGVGKTLLARELARVVSGDEDSLVVFEMAQYRGSLALFHLVGAPPGYVGHGKGRLVNALRDSPGSVLFFDEIDKTDAPVLDLLLRFINSGFVQDAAGPVRDGRKAIVILATNAGRIDSIEGHQANAPA